MLRISLLIALIIVLITNVCDAQLKELGWIYKGQPAIQEGITVSAWGSGKADDNNTRSIEGSNSIEIYSGSFFAGGKVEWLKPVSIPVAANNYIQFVMYFSANKTINPAGSQSDWYGIEPYRVPSVDQLRMIFVAEDGTKTSYVCYTNPIDIDDSWMRVYVPVGKLKIPAGATEYKLKQILFFSSYRSTFYVGQIKTIEDTSAIKIVPLNNQSIAVGDNLFYQAETSSGASTLRYTWNWGDGTPPEKDTSDKIGSHLYKKGGDFTVTLTVTDAAGIKSPATAKVKVYVSQ